MGRATSHTRKDAAILAALLEDYTNVITDLVTTQQDNHSRSRVGGRTVQVALTINRAYIYIGESYRPTPWPTWPW